MRKIDINKKLFCYILQLVNNNWCVRHQNPKISFLSYIVEYWLTIQKHQKLCNRIQKISKLKRPLGESWDIYKQTEIGQSKCCMICKKMEPTQKFHSRATRDEYTIFAISTANQKAQFTFWNVVSVGSNTSVKLHSRLMNVLMVIRGTLNVSPTCLSADASFHLAVRMKTLYYKNFKSK